MTAYARTLARGIGVRFRSLYMLALLAFALPGIAHAACTPAVLATAAGPDAGVIHSPANWDGAVPVPLVLLLHGSTGTGAEAMSQSGLARTADTHGFLLIAPDAGIAAARGYVWNIPDVPTVEGTIPGPGDRDDVAFLTGLAHRLVQAGCVDPARVYATGISGGGRMASWLGCVASDTFAAIAPVVGLRAGNPDPDDPTRADPATCRPARPVAVVAFAGDADHTNPIDGGGAGYWQYTMHAAEQRWAQIDGCRAAPTTRWVEPGVYEERYADCRAGTEVIGRIHTGRGHEWVADNEALWRLLSAYRLPAAG